MSTSQNEMHIYEMWTDRYSSAEGDHMPVKWADIIYVQKKQDLPLLPSRCVDLTVSTQKYHWIYSTKIRINVKTIMICLTENLKSNFIQRAGFYKDVWCPSLGCFKIYCSVSFSHAVHFMCETWQSHTHKHTLYSTLTTPLKVWWIGNALLSILAWLWLSPSGSL